MLQSKHHEGALESEELRAKLYELGELCQLGRFAVDGMNERDTVEGLLGLRNLLKSTSDTLFSIAGGGTFDRFSRLEELNEEAQS
jgi:hypothetical protein